MMFKKARHIGMGTVMDMATDMVIANPKKIIDGYSKKSIPDKILNQIKNKSCFLIPETVFHGIFVASQSIHLMYMWHPHVHNQFP